ncbi:unnamed protein product [Heterobilharzia americana]|nr:unnamed protein product [Heterobilharzia americana]
MCNSSMKMTSSMNVMMELKSSRQTLQEIDKYTKRVIVFVAAETGITAILALSLYFLPDECRTCAVIMTAYVIFMILDLVTIAVISTLKLTEKFPSNLLLTMLHSLFPSVMIGIPFICLDIIWEFAVWAVALMLYITSTALGTILRKDIFHYMVFWIVYYVVTFAVAITFGLLVHFKIIECQCEIVIIGAAVIAALIPIAIGFGQITLGEPKFRSFGTDYCLASIFSHGMLIALLMTSRIGFTITKIGNSGLHNQTHHVYDIF